MDPQYSYSQPGMTRRPAPAGFVVDRRHEQLGQGFDCYQQAKAAIAAWAMFDQGWVSLAPANALIEVGTIVTVTVRVGPVLWPNRCRIVYTIDEIEPVRRFGFAYGTLTDHAECGEERFLVEMLADGSVWYDLLAYSRPRHWLARLGYPLTRRLQKQFGAGSVAAMRRRIRCEEPRRSAGE